jgi:hypothetical protein
MNPKNPLAVLAVGVTSPELADDPASVLLSSNYSQIDASLYNGLLLSLHAWDKLLKDDSEAERAFQDASAVELAQWEASQSKTPKEARERDAALNVRAAAFKRARVTRLGQLYSVMAADVEANEDKVTALITNEKLPASVIQGVLQLWGTYVLTWHVIRHVLVSTGPKEAGLQGDLFEGGQERGASATANSSAIEIARQLGGVVALPPTFTPPAIFRSIQSRALPVGEGGQVHKLSRPSDGESRAKVSNLPERSSTAAEVFSASINPNGPQALRTNGSLTPAALANIFRIDPSRISAIENGAFFKLRKAYQDFGSR